MKIFDAVRFLILSSSWIAAVVSSPFFQFQVPIAPSVLLQQYWLNQTFYSDFLSEGLFNQRIVIGPWNPIYHAHEEEKLNILKWNSKLKSKFCGASREVRSFHPMHKDHSYLRILCGVVPEFAESVRAQTLHYGSTRQEFRLMEKGFFRGIPFSDIFEVEVLWDIKAFKTVDSLCEDASDVSIYVNTVFHKPSLFRHLIDQNTHKELRQVFELWKKRISAQCGLKAFGIERSALLGLQNEHSFFIGQ